MAHRPRLICLMGPTASGKTDLAIELAAARNCELISVDSVLVYRGLDIGSAKPTYPHHLIDIRDPAQAYSAAEFVADARRLAAQISARGKTPLLVGGTMLYFRALLEGLAEMPGADRAIRREIEAEAALHGWPHLHAQLARIDPAAAARIHPNHSQRLCRALEVYRASGIPLSAWHQTQKGSGPLPGDGHYPPREEKGSEPFWDYDIVQMAICPAERAVLHRRIARRFAAMMAAGFLDEVRGLWRRGDLHPDLPALRAVGYRQLWQHLAGECSLEQAVERGVAASRQLAKRQLTWLRKWPDLAWMHTDSAGNLRAWSRSQHTIELSGQKPLQQALNYLDSPSL